jgi:hypothetical protein
MTRRAHSSLQNTKLGLEPSRLDLHEALTTLARLLARAEARRWLASNRKGLDPTNATD